MPGNSGHRRHLSVGRDATLDDGIDSFSEISHEDISEAAAISLSDRFQVVVRNLVWVSYTKFATANLYLKSCHLKIDRYF